MLRFLRITGLVMLLILSASVATAAASGSHHRKHSRHHRSLARATRARAHRTTRTRTTARAAQTSSSSAATPAQGRHRATGTTTTPATTPTATPTATPTTTPTATVTAPAVIAPTTTSVANTFGQQMFGIAAGGNLQNETSTQLATDLTADAAVGSKWLRIDINWAQIQAGGPTSYNWTNIDAVVSGAESRGMNVLGVIVYNPSWNRPTGTAATYGPSPASYAAFALTAVKHYAAMGVHAYEIWNEENTIASWTPAPSPSAYASLLQAAYPAIKSADPSATVVTGGLSPAPTDGTNIAPVDFLKAVYAAGGKGSFDAVGAHPYCWPAMPGSNDTWSAWYQMANTTNSLVTVMAANGDGAKKIWGTEYGAPTNGPAGSYVSQDTQAQMITAAFKVWSGYSWAGPLFVYQGRDQGTDTSTRENFFGIQNFDGTPKPAYTAYQQAAATY